MSAQGKQGPVGCMGIGVIICWLCLGLFFSGTVLAGEVWLVPVRGTIEWGLAGFVRRAVGEASSAGAAAVMLEINTFGGRVDAATEIRDVLLASPVPVITYVTERAWSAGALIAMSGEHLAMAPSSTIGAAEPRPADEKTISAVRAEFEATAQGRGRDHRLAGAMVDKDVIIEGVVEGGKILTLSANQALDLGFADLVAANRGAVLKELGLAGERVHETRPSLAELVAGFVTQPILSSFLLTLGFAGLVLELLTPGFGVPGTIGVLSLVLFFGGRLVTGLAGWEVAMLFLAGFVLLLLEALVIPGFGVAGILGLGGIFGSIVLSYATTEAGLISLAVSLLVTILVVVVGWKYFRRSRAWQRLVLETVVGETLPAEATGVLAELVGKRGLALTPLRPAGIVEIDGERVDVVTDGGFLAKDSLVQVVEVKGNRIIVKSVMTDEAND